MFRNRNRGPPHPSDHLAQERFFLLDILDHVAGKTDGKPSRLILKPVKQKGRIKPNHQFYSPTLANIGAIVLCDKLQPKAAAKR
jgi:hypothetical protein